MGFLTNTYVLAFLKFAVLASLGEVIALSMRSKKLTIPPLFAWRVLIWGLLGVVISFMMKLYAGAGLQFLGQPEQVTWLWKLKFAFLTSLVMNLSFGPVFMVFHKHTDTYLDMRYEDAKAKISLQDVCARVDYYAYIKNVLIGTIPTFWLPAHTITFLLPPQYRVFFAAILSICLGILLSLKSK